VHCSFVTAGERFAKLVAGKEYPLAVRSARRVEFGLLGVGLIVGEPVFS